MRGSLLLLTMLALPLLSVAQVTDLYNDQRNGTLNDRFAQGYFMAPRDNLTVEGSVFLLPGWTPGRLQLNGNAKPLDAPLKYDIYNQEVRAKRPNGDSVAVAVMRVQEFTLATRRFVCYPAATLPSETGGGCGEVLYESPAVQLLKFERKTLEKRAAAGSYATAATVPVLEAHTNYYLRWTADKRLVALKPKRASLEQALAGHPAALAALKVRKGSIGTEAELTAALAGLAASL